MKKTLMIKAHTGKLNKLTLYSLGTLYFWQIFTSSGIVRSCIRLIPSGCILFSTLTPFVASHSSMQGFLHPDALGTFVSAELEKI